MTPDHRQQLAAQARAWLIEKEFCLNGPTRHEVELLADLLAAAHVEVLEEVAAGYEQKRNGYLSMLKERTFEHERLLVGAKEELLDVQIRDLRELAQERRP